MEENFFKVFRGLLDTTAALWLKINGNGKHAIEGTVNEFEDD